MAGAGLPDMEAGALARVDAAREAFLGLLELRFGDQRRRPAVAHQRGEALRLRDVELAPGRVDRGSAARALALEQRATGKEQREREPWPHLTSLISLQ